MMTYDQFSESVRLDISVEECSEKRLRALYAQRWTPREVIQMIRREQQQAQSKS